MPFVRRLTEEPPLNEQLELEQILIIDKTGPALSVGPSPGAVCLVGEFLKGPFAPSEVFSSGDVLSRYGTLSPILSQDTLAAAAVQDGSGIAFNGNGALQLKSKSFRRLILSRVDTDCVTSGGGTSKAAVKFDVSIDASDQDATPVTTRDILIPAGTRFADDAIALATVVVALSQDVTIPKGTAVVAGKVSVTFTTGNGNGTLGATCFFVKGVTAAIALVDTVIDPALPNVKSTIALTGISTIDLTGGASAIFAPGSGATLKARIESVYGPAIDITMPTAAPMEDITHIWAARRSSTVRPLVVANAIAASQVSSRARTSSVAADPSESSSAADAATCKTNALALAFTENYQVDRAIVCFPHVMVFSTELGSVNVPVSADGFMASILSNIPPERNPGAPTTLLSFIQDVEPAFKVNPLVRGDYVLFRAGGICALRKDRVQSWQYQSGVTAAAPVDPTRKNIARRTMADFIQEGLADLAGPYVKVEATDDKKEALVGAWDAFLATLESKDKPSTQRIRGYTIDDKSQNTETSEDLGEFAVLIKVKTLPSLDVIKIVAEIGETVSLTEAG